MPSYRRSRCSDPRQRAARRVAPIVSIPVGCELAAPVPLQKLFSGEISVKPDVLLQVRPE